MQGRTISVHINISNKMKPNKRRKEKKTPLPDAERTKERG
jgi:hypothetical protein